MNQSRKGIHSMKTKSKIALAAILSLSAALFFSAGLNDGVAQDHNSGLYAGCWCATGASQFPGYNPNAKVTYTSEGECARKGGHCFSSKEEAYHYVHTPQRRRPTTCWCYIPVECLRAPCPPGRVMQITATECQKHGGHCFSSQEEAYHYRDRSTTIHRSSRSVWCCMHRNGHHKVMQTTEAECQANGGNCYSSYYGAQTACAPPGAVY